MRVPSTNPVTLRFGVTDYPYSKTNPHVGIDFFPSPDLAIYAPEGGRITLLRNDPQMGNSVHLYVGNRHHAFCHMSQITVPNGAEVKEGDKLGIMGYSGYVVPAGPLGTHLHWALAVDNILINPLTLITPGKGAQVSEASIFNEGDRRKINIWLYGEDRLLWPAAIGMGFKEAIEAIFTSQEYQNNRPKGDAEIKLEKLKKYIEENL